MIRQHYRHICCHQATIDYKFRAWCPVSLGLCWLFAWWPNRDPVEHVNVSLALACRTEDHPSQQTLHCLMCIVSILIKKFAQNYRIVASNGAPTRFSPVPRVHDDFVILAYQMVNLQTPHAN